MSTYVMSDIHGEYEKFLSMLEAIHFTDEDELFILGDLVDRGPKPMELVLDIMGRANVFALMGNHDYIAYDILSRLNVEITDTNYTTQLDSVLMRCLLEWLANGGRSTFDGFHSLSADQKKDVLDYLFNLPLYEAVDVGDRTFVLTHAGLGNFRDGKKLHEYSPADLIEHRTDPEQELIKDPSVYMVWGHTPTMIYRGKPQIFCHGRNFCIDCGACFDGGRLACMRLDDLAEFYIG